MTGLADDGRKRTCGCRGVSVCWCGGDCPSAGDRYPCDPRALQPDLRMLADELRAIAAGCETTLNAGEADRFAAALDALLADPNWCNRQEGDRVI